MELSLLQCGDPAEQQCAVNWVLLTLGFSDAFCPLLSAPVVTEDLGLGLLRYIQVFSTSVAVVADVEGG